MRSAAKEAAMTARFTPASVAGELASTWLSFAFPGKEESSNFAATAPEPVSDGQRYTIKGETNFEPLPPPPDHRGPVNVAATPSTPPPNFPKQIAGGVLNGKAYELPKPPYPPAARAVRASGAVSVQVLIDESGEVFMARAVDGHPLLRSASVTAACGSRFSPTRLSGHPVKVSGIITYNFVP
jgi:protein TonB